MLGKNALKVIFNEVFLRKKIISTRVFKYIYSNSTMLYVTVFTSRRE